MKQRGTSRFISTIMAVLMLTASGCSSMKWFQSGSDETSKGQPGSDPRFAEGERLPEGDKAGQNAQTGKGDADQSSKQESGYPSISRQESMGDPEGGSLRGLIPLVNGQIAAEERLSRSDYSSMMLPVDRSDKRFAELRREEAAAIEAGLRDVFYGYDRWTISDDGGVALVKNADWLRENPKAMLKISGHCDERGTHDYNLVLGEKRAKAAKSYLIDLGVSPKQVAIVSYGKDRPFCAQHDETCYQQNRRGHMMLRK
jgi:peptidoglycan-associated lipoprotein